MKLWLVVVASHPRPHECWLIFFFVVTVSLGFKVANALRPESIVLVYSTEWEGWQD